MIYDEVNTSEWSREGYHRLNFFGHWIYYARTSQALALLRNSDVWENDVSSALSVQRATKSFTLVVSWEKLYYRRVFAPSCNWLLKALKAIDEVYAMDLDHQRKSTAARKWTTPLHSSLIRYGISCLRTFVDCSPSGVPYKDDPTHRPEEFLQTMILQLRRKPEINVRILVWTDWAPESIEEQAANVKVNIKQLLTRINRGETTRLPRARDDIIRHQITLISIAEQIEYWKERLRSVEQQVQWEEADQDEVYIRKNN